MKLYIHVHANIVYADNHDEIIKKKTAERVMALCKIRCVILARLENDADVDGVE